MVMSTSLTIERVHNAVPSVTRRRLFAWPAFLVFRQGLWAACLCWASAAVADGEGRARELPTVTVEGQVVGEARTEATSRQSALAWLRQVAGLDLSNQGVGGQGDIQIRGSSFSGAGLSLAGLALRNPQTEHFHAEIPMPWQLFEEPTVLTGLEQAQRSTGHLVGTVDLALAPIASGGSLDLGFGARGHDWQEGLWQKVLASEGENGGLAMSLFGGRETAGGFDYSDNGLKRWSGGGQIQLQGAQGQTDLIVGTQFREFGARGYYGAPASLPSKETVRDTLVLGTWQSNTDGSAIQQATVLYRQFGDLYLLDEDRPGLYRNRHRSDTMAAAAGGGVSITDPLAVNWRLEAEEERLDSAYRGSLPSTGLGEHRRRRGGALLLPEFIWGRWTLAAGSRVLFFSDDRPAVLPAFGVSVSPAEGQVLSVSYARGVRLPSFTELAYDSPGSLGDAGLERQESAEWDVAWRGRWTHGGSWHLGAFTRREHNAVDWVKDTLSARWQAVNLRRLRIIGADARVEWPLTSALRVGGAYTHLHKRTRSDVFASRYVLDFPEHEVRLTAEWAVTERCSIVAAQTVHYHADNPVRTSDRTGANGSLSAHLRFPRHPALRVTAGVDNLWGDTFEVFPGQPSTARRGSLAISCVWR